MVACVECSTQNAVAKCHRTPNVMRTCGLLAFGARLLIRFQRWEPPYCIACAGDAISPGSINNCSTDSFASSCQVA